MAIYQVAIFVVFHRGCSRALQDGKTQHHTTPSVSHRTRSKPSPINTNRPIGVNRAGRANRHIRSRGAVGDR
ncbi:hypothetical protein C0J52_01705 [Blattella germanica]|nr:hypothetical protein C0J52_01705 [Blattella germanica]